mmetsp:Transcript_18335/g.46306  ORF Transcript_18335/g.46306 Transcript_18335/m.46306 type:complete len:211 (-) Transcript_18335:456-1088(-)
MYSAASTSGTSSTVDSTVTKVTISGPWLYLEAMTKEVEAQGQMASSTRDMPAAVDRPHALAHAACTQGSTTILMARMMSPFFTLPSQKRLPCSHTPLENSASGTHVLVSMSSELISHPSSSTYCGEAGSSHLRSPEAEMATASSSVHSMGFRRMMAAMAHQRVCAVMKVATMRSGPPWRRRARLNARSSTARRSSVGAWCSCLTPASGFS